TGQEAAGIHRRITVENNIIQGTDGNAIRIGYANQADIVGNVIDNSNKEAIFIHNSRNVRVSGNKVTNSSAGLGFGDGCETATIKVENNVGF
ncbi:MAG TPA: NosD domain-containing protein, partial [Sedimentisphaerales bacterium]|nr:NosD domain-containing protein [Sedimentisphaerales bacterium]